MFHVNIVKQNEFHKNYGFFVFFNQFYATSFQQICCHGNIVDDILIKASGNNDT